MAYIVFSYFIRQLICQLSEKHLNTLKRFPHLSNLKNGIISLYVLYETYKLSYFSTEKRIFAVRLEVIGKFKGLYLNDFQVSSSRSETTHSHERWKITNLNGTNLPTFPGWLTRTHDVFYRGYPVYNIYKRIPECLNLRDRSVLKQILARSRLQLFPFLFRLFLYVCVSYIM